MNCAFHLASVLFLIFAFFIKSGKFKMQTMAITTRVIEPGPLKDMFFESLLRNHPFDDFGSTSDFNIDTWGFISGQFLEKVF